METLEYEDLPYTKSHFVVLLATKSSLNRDKNKKIKDCVVLFVLLKWVYKICFFLTRRLYVNQTIQSWANHFG